MSKSAVLPLKIAMEKFKNIEFKDDFDILDKYKNNLEKLRSEIDKQNINF